MVLFNHGYAEHGGRYHHIARYLNDHANALVAAIDLEGHGHSAGDPAVLDFKDTVADLHKLVEIAREQAGNPNAPVLMFGHSMGGLLTARYLQTYGEQAAVKAAGFLGAVIGAWDWPAKILSKVPASRQFLDGTAPDLAGMSRDVYFQDQYRNDPLVYHGDVPRRLIEREAVEIEEFLANVNKLNLPMLVLHGSQDPFVPYKPSLSAMLQSPSQDLTLRLYPGARHELVNETNRQQVFEDLLAFVRRIIASS